VPEEGHVDEGLLFFRLRLPSGSTGRMWNMRMSQGQKKEMDHSGHVMR
jgi:hypothetical protein